MSGIIINKIINEGDTVTLQIGTTTLKCCFKTDYLSFFCELLKMYIIEKNEIN